MDGFIVLVMGWYLGMMTAWVIIKADELEQERITGQAKCVICKR